MKSAFAQIAFVVAAGFVLVVLATGGGFFGKAVEEKKPGFTVIVNLDRDGDGERDVTPEWGCHLFVPEEAKRCVTKFREDPEKTAIIGRFGEDNAQSLHQHIINSQGKQPGAVDKMVEEAKELLKEPPDK